MVNSEADSQQNGLMADPRHQKALFQFGTGLRLGFELGLGT
jgi:hypothetical protein